MTDALKPCPFCGNAFPAAGYDSDMRALGRDDCITARCRQCGAETRKFSNAPEAITAWNTRADLATPTPSMCCLGLTPEQCANTPSSQCDGLRPAVDPLDDPRVKALVKALQDMTALAIQLGAIDLETRDALAALSALKENK